jgi:hypothetical protein
MRMAPNQFITDCFDNIFKVEGVPFLAHLRVHDDLKEQIAKFLAQVRVIRFLDCLDRLITFLNEGGAQALMSLLTIPGTASRRAQSGDDFP